MSLKLPYRKIPDGKGSYGYYAALAVNIALLQKSAPRSKRFEAIIDSGASRCIFHADIGRAIGLNISSGAVETTLGVAGPINTYLHDVCLYIPGGAVIVRAGFSGDLPVAGLLGMQGFFDVFKITFDPTLLCCKLDRLYKV